MSIKTPITPLLLTVFTSISEVFLLCLSGYILAGKGILDKKTQQQLNRLNVSLFTPALLFSKVAFSLSPAKLRELWVVPIFFAIVTLASMTVAFTLGWMFHLKKSQRGFAMAAAMFMNSNSLPIALMQSLVFSLHSLRWGADDNKNAMLGRALTYLVVYSTLGMIVRWSYGVRLLSQYQEEEFVPEVEVEGVDEDGDEAPLLPSFGQEQRLHTSSSSIINETESTIGSFSAHLPPPRHTTFYKSFPNSPNQEEARLPYSSVPTSALVSPVVSDGEESGGEGEIYDTMSSSLPVHGSTTKSLTTLQALFFRVGRRLHRGWVKLNNFTTVPLWASLASVFVVCVPPLQHGLEHHMQPVKGALSSAGNCSIPVTLVVLGAYFYTPPTSEEQKDRRGNRRNVTAITTSISKETLMHRLKTFLHLRKTSENDRVMVRKAAQQRTVSGETKTVVIAVLSRMVITPLLLMPFLALLVKFNLQRVFDDPVFIVSNVLLLSSPPALTLAQVSQAASSDAFESLISRTIFWSYCVVTPPATIFYVVLGLLFAQL